MYDSYKIGTLDPEKIKSNESVENIKCNWLWFVCPNSQLNGKALRKALLKIITKRCFGAAV